MTTFTLQKPESTSEISPLVPEFFATIQDLLRDPAVFPTSSATKLTELLKPSMAAKDASGDQAVEDLWGTLFWTVKQIPPDHEYQARLVSLVLSMRDLPAPSGPVADSFEAVVGERFWRDLPYSRKGWSWYERAAPLVPRMEDRPGFKRAAATTSPPWSARLDGSEWTRLHAFSARLHSSTDLRYLDLRGLFALLEALEREQQPAALDNLVPAAACWILYAGQKLKDNSIPYPTYDFDDQVKRSPWSVGELYHGPKGFNTERWGFWRSRFGVMAKHPDLKTETKQWAVKAETRMADM